MARFRARKPDTNKPKTPRITDKAAPLIGAVNKMATNVAYGFAHNQRFSYGDFLNLFVAPGSRACLLEASEVAHSNCGWVNSCHIDMSGAVARVSIQGTRFLFPKPPALVGLDACTDMELRKRFTDHFEQKREMAIGFARARVVIKHLVENYEPHVATYLLPSLQLLAEGTGVEKHFVRKGVGSVPTLPYKWREACKRVAATITAAQLVGEYAGYPDGLEMLVQLEAYVHQDLYVDAADTHETLTLEVKDST